LAVTANDAEARWRRVPWAEREQLPIGRSLILEASEAAGAGEQHIRVIDALRDAGSGWIHVKWTRDRPDEVELEIQPGHPALRSPGMALPSPDALLYNPLASAPRRWRRPGRRTAE
jgi:hypothetical protein